MGRICLTIKEYDWEVVAFFHATNECLRDIHDALYWAEAPIWIHKRIKLSLNSGFTYSNKEKGKSVVVICEASSKCETEDTLSHEKYHLTRHISTACGIDPDTEEAAYLSGHIGKLLCCDCPSCKH